MEKIIDLEYSDINGRYYWRKRYSNGSVSQWYATGYEVSQGTWFIETFLLRLRPDIVGTLEYPDRDTPPASQTNLDGPGKEQIVVQFLKRLEERLKKLVAAEKGSPVWHTLNHAVFEAYCQLQDLDARDAAKEVLLKYGMDLRNDPKSEPDRKEAGQPR